MNHPDPELLQSRADQSRLALALLSLLLVCDWLAEDWERLRGILRGE